MICSLNTFAQHQIKPDQEITFKKTTEVDLKLHTFYPNKYKSNNHHPAIVFFFGGGWNSENKTQFFRQAKYLASKGMLAFCADYRVKSKHNVSPDKCVMDAKSAIRYIRSNFGIKINPNQIIASGGSAGGHLAASTALLPLFDDDHDDLQIDCIPNALILFNPVLDTSKIKRLGKNAINLSPHHHITINTPNTLIMHGTKDELVSHEQAIDFHQKMKMIGNQCELELYENMPHGFFNSKKYVETLERTEEFIRSLGWIE